MLPITDTQTSVALKKNSTMTVITKWAKTQLRKSKIKPSDNKTTADIVLYEDRKQPKKWDRLFPKTAKSNKIENNDDTNNTTTIILPKPNFNISFIEELRSSCPFILGHEPLPNAASPPHTPPDTTFDQGNSQLSQNVTFRQGSPRHFAYTQTLRKYKDANRDVRPLYNVVLLNAVLKKLHTSPLTLSEEQELRLYKSKNSRMKVTQDKEESHDPRNIDKCANRNGKNVEGRSVVFRSFAFAQKARTNNNSQQSQSGTQPRAPYLPKKLISLSQYRASYASQAVVITIDDKSNKLMTRDLPMARRHRSLFSSPDVPERVSSLLSSSSSSSSSSPASVKKSSSNNQKWEKGTRIRPWLIKRNDVLTKDDEDGHVDLDEVPLYVLREQYKYSGRNCSYSDNRELVNDGSKPMALAM